MPSFIPLVAPEQLPTVGAAIERSVMDWKGEDTATAFHKAKDVAAFANHLGGTIIVGAVEAGGVLVHYKGIDPADAEKIVKDYSAAVRDRCQPFPVFDSERFPAPGDATKAIIAVNVWPSLLLTGVKIYAHKPTEGYGGVSYAYPVRVGIDADYLEPSKLAMYMTPQVRRVAVMLSKITRGALVRLHRTDDGHNYEGRMGDVKEDENYVSVMKPDNDSTLQNIPLDRIKTVYLHTEPDTARSVHRIVYGFLGT